MQRPAMHLLNFCGNSGINFCAAQISVENFVGESPAVLIGLTAHTICWCFLHGLFGHTHNNAHLDDFRGGVVLERREVTALVAPLGVVANIGLAHIAGIGYSAANLVGDKVENHHTDACRMVKLHDVIRLGEVLEPGCAQTIPAVVKEIADIVGHPLNLQETAAIFRNLNILLSSQRHQNSDNTVTTDRSDAGRGDCRAVLTSANADYDRGVGAILGHIFTNPVDDAIGLNLSIEVGHIIPPITRSPYQDSSTLFMRRSSSRSRCLISS